MIEFLRPTADVRMFHGWGESVLWLDGDLSYEDLHLPKTLTSDLRNWDLRWQEYALDARDSVRRRADRQNRREGHRLALRVAECFGETVVLSLQQGRWGRRLRGQGPAKQPLAVAHIHRTKAAAARVAMRTQKHPGSDEVLGWFADPPLKNT